MSPRCFWWILFLWCGIQVAECSCVDIGNETRSCTRVNSVGENELANYTVRCNTTSGLYDILETTRCGTSSFMFCRNSRSVDYACQYQTSCDYALGIINDETQFTDSPQTKSLSCDGLDLTLEYTFDNDTGECRYSMDETSNSDINTRLLISFQDLAASTVWTYHPGSTGGSVLQATVSPGPSLNSLCTYVKSYATQYQFECVVPFINEIGTFCSLASIVRVKCNEHDIRCDRTIDNLYVCTNIGTATVLSMSCSGNTATDIAKLITDFEVMDANSFTDLGNLTSPVNLIDGRSNSQCTEMALICRDTPNAPGTDFFNCTFPYVGPGDGPVNSSFCELAYTYTQVDVNCYAQDIPCFSQTSREDTHLCSYSAGYLRVNCEMNGTELAELYELQDQFRQLYYNCTSTVGCDPNDFQRLELIRTRSLLSLESDYEEDSDTWYTHPILSEHTKYQIAHMEKMYRMSQPFRELRSTFKHYEPFFSMQVIHRVLNIPTHRVLTTKHGILEAGVHPLYKPHAIAIHGSHVLASEKTAFYLPHHTDVEFYTGRSGSCLGVKLHNNSCRGHLVHIHPLPHLRHMLRFAQLPPIPLPPPATEKKKRDPVDQWTSHNINVGRRLLSLGDVQTDYTRLLGLAVNEEDRVCNLMLDMCNPVTGLTCVDGDSLSQTKKRDRTTFCSSPLAPSCQNFSGNMPTNVTRVFINTNLINEYYAIRCPVRDDISASAFTDDTGASDSLFHDITCNRIPINGQCYYLCTSSGILTMSAFPVLASVLLNPALTTSATGQRLICAHIRSVALDTANEDNVFFCPLPYETTSVSIFNVGSQENVTYVKDICVLSTLVDQVQLNCGETLVTCVRDFSTLLFTCESNTYSCLVNGTCANLYPYIRATGVPESVLIPPPTLTQNARCLQLEQYATNFSCPLSGPCVINNATNCSRTNSPSVYCTTNFDPNQSPQTIQFDCGLSALSNLTVPLTCTLNPNVNNDTLYTYTCTQTYRQSQVPELTATGFSLSTTPLTMTCDAIDAATLALTYGPTSGSGTDILVYATASQSDLDRNLARCLFVKRSCTDDTDLFRCNCNFLQDTLSNQFCDVPAAPSTSADSNQTLVSAVQINETIACGETPVHQIYCRNSINATGAVYGKWTRCSIPTTSEIVLGATVQISPGPFDFDCLVRTSQYSDSMLDNSTCELLRIQCQFPFSCDAALDCECPPAAVSDQSVFNCHEPAQVCRNNLCQFQPTSLTGNDTGNAFLGQDVCDFQPDTIQLLCNSPPFGPNQITEVRDIRTGLFDPFPIYNITCVKQTIGVDFQQLVLYTCTNDNTDNENHTMRMNVTVPYKTLKYFFLSSDAACLALGQAGVEANQLVCGGPYLATHDYPFCSTALEDPDSKVGRFYCDGLLITCTPDDLISCATGNLSTCTPTRVRCFSEEDSLYWHLGRNRDIENFPSPFGFQGCVLGEPTVPGDFYNNVEQRCQTILHQCIHSCLDTKAYNDTGIELLNTELKNLSICESFLNSQSQFKCDTQDIVCTPVDLTNEQRFNVTITTGLVEGADFERNNGYLHCKHIQTVETIYNNSLDLDCLVNVFAFNQQPDVCRTLVSQCRQNAGTFRCLGTYRQTEDAPFCTLQYTPLQARTLCNLGFWHSTHEGKGLIPSAAIDQTCYDYDPDNIYQGIVPNAGDPELDPDAGAPAEEFGGPPELLVLNRRTDTNLAAQCSLYDAETGMDCRRLGYISYPVYLRRVAALRSTPYQRLYYNHFTKKKHENKRYWCLWSYNDPRPICAIKPGMGLTMCTVECPMGLVETSIMGSRTRYCCRGGETQCTTVDDPRNCVKGRHDPTCEDQPWSCRNASTNAYLSESAILDLKTEVLVIRDNQSVSIVPTRICPENPLLALSSFPIPETKTAAHAPEFEKRYARVLTAANDDPEIHGFSVIPDRFTGRSGLYVWSRPGQVTYFNAPETDEEFTLTEIMTSVDPTNRHDLDQTKSYHLHPTSVDTVDRYASYMSVWPDSDILSTSVFVERAYGYDCRDERFNFQEYLNLNPGALARSNARMQAHLQFMGADQTLKRAMDFSTPQKQNLIRIDQRHNIFDNSGPNGSIAFPFRTFLQMNTDQQVSNDLLLGITWNGSSIDTGATFVVDSISGSIQCASNCPNETNRWSVLHPHYSSLRRIPIWGNLSWDTDDSMEIVVDSSFPHAVIRSGLSGNDVNKVVQVGFTPLPPGLNVVQFPNFWYLMSYVTYLDWVVHGHAYTRGLKRASPSKRCTLNTPLYKEGVVSPDGKRMGDSNSNVCPKPVVPTYNFRTQGTSISPQVGRFPNPLPEFIPHLHDSIPCGDHGVCISPDGSPGSGTCRCYAPYIVEVNLFELSELGATSPPTSIQFLACDEDIRGKCIDDLSLVGVVCGGHGVCVSDFVNNRRVANCRCGNFPVDPLSTKGERCNKLGTCYSRRPQLSWELGGFVNGDFADDFCTTPRHGCHSEGPWIRQSIAFSRGNSYGCEIPPISTSTGLKYGNCGLVPGYTDVTADASWTCTCNIGHYGRRTTCEYFTLASKCFDPDRERFTIPVGQVRSTVSYCVWNRHFTRIELLTHTNLSPTELQSAPQFVCRGNPCSGHGECVHEGMNNDTMERWELQPNATLAFETPGELTFAAAVLDRIQNQHCECQDGWTGDFCQLRECAGGCGSGECVFDITRPNDAPTCSCPKDSTGRVLVSGDKCEGEVCFGRGNLTQSESGVWSCVCNEPYVQVSKTGVCTGVCDCSAKCAPNQGTITTTSDRLHLPACSCTGSVLGTVLCDDTILGFSNTTRF